MAASTTPDRCGCRHPSECVDRRAGRYLTVVYWLTDDGHPRARTGEVSDRLGVAAATVTETFARLAAAGYVDYEKRTGVALTERGRAVARELAWRQCTVRAFFLTELGVEFAVEDGYRVGYVLPRDGIERLRDRLSHCPDAGCHGPIRRRADCLCDTLDF